MRSKQRRNLSTTGVTVPAVSTGALPVLTEHAQLDAALETLERGGLGYRLLGVSIHPSPQERVSCLEAALPFVGKWRAEWRVLDQPATIDQIATETLRLTTTMPNAGNIDQGMLADTLCEDIAELRPTVWALLRGCRAHRGNSEFLSFAKLEKEIRSAESRARGYREVLMDRDLAEELKFAEESVRRERQRDVERERQQKLLEKRRAEEKREWARWRRDHGLPAKLDE